MLHGYDWRRTKLCDFACPNFLGFPGALRANFGNGIFFQIRTGDVLTANRADTEMGCFRMLQCIFQFFSNGACKNHMLTCCGRMGFAGLYGLIAVRTDKVFCVFHRTHPCRPGHFFQIAAQCIDQQRLFRLFVYLLSNLFVNLFFHRILYLYNREQAVQVPSLQQQKHPVQKRSDENFIPIKRFHIIGAFIR